MKNYLNLTSGLEYISVYPELEFSLVRIQSSHLEAGALWKVIEGLDYDFLINAALGGVVLYDCGSRRGELSRAQWMGIPWIKFVYQTANKLTQEYKGVMSANFEQVYGRTSPYKDDCKKKLRYVHKITGANRLEIKAESMISTMDGDYEKLKNLLISA